MRALTWQGPGDVRVETVPDPTIQAPTDAVIRVTSSAICGSDLHLYEVLGPFLAQGDILGHEPMGVVEEVGSETGDLQVGDRVVVPFTISCGHCWMCERQWFAACETTQNRDQGMGASLFGFTKLYGQVAGGQAEYLRVPQAQFGPIKVPDGPADERFLYLSDVLPTAWQGVEYARVPDGGSVAVFGLGPIGQMAARIARHRGYRAIAVDSVPERLAMARRHGIEVIDSGRVDDVTAAIRDLTDGRGTDSAIDAVGMEAHGGSAIPEIAQKVVNRLPDAISAPIMQVAGVDRTAALVGAVDAVRRAGVVSLSGVYGGTADPINMLKIFDKGISLQMGQAHVKRWIPEILPLLTEDDPLGVHDLETHRLPLESAAHGYEIFQKKQDECIKVVLAP
ncbi:glutathione-dependent formaldehyde dehydrogenase [Actinomycetospora sp. NBRC 106375]|uniref:zinc-dependent alcohol dehydrogenase n=1 Tax=Actinomycetospora sp. NBRC 106375 TaxID=3032207 RepID=UPI0024A5FDB7|nr:zinc-dependent alcohol dehydrogenase [Actinomycetospora sp. NBRC 106375]GLZ48609.1 glutathione-dependent formaldehyde dehydrogenase [Actinomycetospora sp. NBRC 106375]